MANPTKPDVDALMREYAEKINEGIEQPIKAQPAPERKLKTVQLQAGQVLLSDLWGVKPKDMPMDDRGVAVATEDDWSDFMKEHLVQPDPAYVVNMETVIACAAVLDNERTLAVGETGSGKSHMFREIAARLGYPFFRQQQFEDMHQGHIVGEMALEKGSTVYKEAPLVTFVREGGIVCLDEIYRAPASINMLLQNLLEDNGYLMLPEGVPLSERKVIPHAKFRICGTDNSEGLGDTTGHHITARRQDTAFLDRWGICLRIDYPTKREEVKRVMKQVPGADKAMVKQLADLATLTRQGLHQGTLEVAMSPRALYATCRQVQNGYPVKAALMGTYLGKLPSDQRDTAQALVLKVFGAE